MKLRKEIWQSVKLGELCEINMGKTPSRSNLANFGKGHTWLSISDFKGNKYINTSKEEITDFALTQARYKLIKENTVLLTFKLTIGKIAIAGKDLYTNEAIAALPLKNKKALTTDFLYTVLQTIDYNSKSDKAVKGATLNKEKLLNLSFSLPPLTEQQQIAELFQNLDDTILKTDEQESKIIELKKVLCNELVNIKPKFGELFSSQNFNPSNFEDIAVCIEQHEKKPLNNGLTRFVGLEHIESENFQLNGWGNISDGTTFTKKFSKGDVLFGKRRAYLRKVAVADFDGICSGDILVIRAKEGKILPDLLPFYIMSEPFINHAISTSAGSLSPRTKWKDLSKLEFSIPGIDTQIIILKVFKQIQLTLSQLKEQKQNLNNLKQKLLNEIFG